MSEDTHLTCQACNASFPYDELIIDESDPDGNTQAHWLVTGRCPKCHATVEFTFKQLQEQAGQVELED